MVAERIYNNAPLSPLCQSKAWVPIRVAIATSNGRSATDLAHDSRATRPSMPAHHPEGAELRRRAPSRWMCTPLVWTVIGWLGPCRTAPVPAFTRTAFRLGSVAWSRFCAVDLVLWVVPEHRRDHSRTPQAARTTSRALASPPDLDFSSEAPNYSSVRRRSSSVDAPPLPWAACQERPSTPPDRQCGGGDASPDRPPRA